MLKHLLPKWRRYLEADCIRGVLATSIDPKRQPKNVKDAMSSKNGWKHMIMNTTKV